MEKEELDNIDKYRKGMNVRISNGEDISEKRDAEQELEGQNSFHTLSNEVEKKKRKVIKDKWLCSISSDEHAYLSTKEVLTELLGVSNEKYNKLENFLYYQMDIDLKFSDVKNCDFLKQFDDIAILLVYRKICLSTFKLNDLMDDTENASLMKTYRIKLKDLIHEMYSNGLVYYRMEYEQFLKLVKNNLS
ncbi:hypothetical protein THOM_2571 [Trachipleistophora hominis]|uniref:Uncharacterized protein n=1 Tax=Trachipleistophora hominis TaxID=72359 RepID=L7JTU3_TRAHO|nr:hypothetical protein THOM_2571 [Trachipleistophora hominis]